MIYFETLKNPLCQFGICGSFFFFFLHEHSFKLIEPEAQHSSAERRMRYI